MWESLIEIPGEGCTNLPGVNLGEVLFAGPILRFLMGRAEGKNGSFLAIR